MRIVRFCLICLLMALTAPLSWGRVAMPEHAAMASTASERAIAMDDEPPCPMHLAAQSAQPAATALVFQADHATARHLPCGDCSACHAVALLPAALQLPSPEPAHTAPGWTPILSHGRLRGCELYRPPQA